MTSAHKTSKLIFRVTPTAASLLNERAKAHGQTKSDYVRAALGAALRRDCLGAEPVKEGAPAQ